MFTRRLTGFAGICRGLGERLELDLCVWPAARDTGEVNAWVALIDVRRLWLLAVPPHSVVEFSFGLWASDWELMELLLTNAICSTRFFCAARA